MKKNILLYIIAVLGIFSCQQEEYNTGLDGREVQIGDQIKMNFSLFASGFNSISSRMDADRESLWDIVWVAQYDSNGDLVGTPRSYSETDLTLDITVKPDKNTFYFITNTPDNPFEIPGSSGQYYNDTTELERSVYTPSNITYYEDSQAKLVMVGKWQGELVEPVVSGSDQTKLILREIVAYVHRLTAKVNIIVEAALESGFQNQTISIEKIQLCGVPKSATFLNGSKTETVDDVDNFAEEVFTAPTEGFRYQSKSYYVLENMHGSVTNDDPAKKGNFAPKDAQGNDLSTYVKIRATLDDGNNNGAVDFRVYLGGNDRNNFDIIRNYHYTITIRILGVNNVETDVRIESTEDLYQFQIQTPDGSAATNRTSETRTIDPDKEFWGWDGSYTSGKSTDHLNIHTNNDLQWVLNSMAVTTTPSNSAYQWNNLKIQYCPNEEDWTDNSNWIDLAIGGSPAPSGAKIRVHTGMNNSSYVRTVTFTFKLYGVQSNVTRQWVVSQRRPEVAFSLPTYSFFQAPAGVYSVAVRSSGTFWKFKSNNSTAITFVGTIGDDGFSSDPDYWQTGHGMVLFRVTAHPGISGNDSHRALGDVFIESKSDITATESIEWKTTVSQLPSVDMLLATSSETATRRFAYDYSSNALFTTAVGYRISIPWAINMVSGVGSEDVNYEKNKGLIGTTSPVTGKENTLTMFNKMDETAAQRLLDLIGDPSLPADINKNSAPIFSPAGICMAMNENFIDINDTSNPDYKWYLPSRNEALMDTFNSMLQLKNGGNGTRAGSIWTSTTLPSTTDTQSAYFAGSGVDVSANHSVTSMVRCIRKNENVQGLSYPHMRNENGVPVIVVREDGKGFVHTYRDRPTITPTPEGFYSERYYYIDYPLRFIAPNYAPARDGSGPIQTEDLTLSPKFQVAKTDLPGNWRWFEASGWAEDLSFNAMALTGCNNYSETGDGGRVYDGWRLPTEMELRMIGLLGGGTSAGPAQQYILQNGGTNFTDIPEFTLLSGSYWGGSEYISGKEKNTRAVYVNIYDLKNIDSPLRGSAQYRNGIREYRYKVRCVRDIKN